MKLVIIDYGAGNTKSVKFAFERLGVNAVLSDDKEVIQSADKVIFPGVGHAKPAMEVLAAKGLDILIPQLKQPVLGICLGMQLMCSHSEEGDSKCLGIFNDLNVVQFGDKLKVPQIGWNKADGNWSISPVNNWFYFVHSYYVPINNQTTLTCNYGINFSAAIQRDNFYAVQFHPEKSGVAGEKLLQNFLAIK